MPQKIFLPTDPNYIIIDVDRNSLKAMQSAEKAPYMIKMSLVKLGLHEVEKYCVDPDADYDHSLPVEVKSFIIKFGDDLRSDILALQILETLMNVSDLYSANLESYPYKIVSTSQGNGIIECIPKSNSINNILREYKRVEDFFSLQFGDKNSTNMQEAKLKYVHSLACSTIFTYLIELKDRHNGNIMFDTSGHLLQIDFGFILGSSPKMPESQIKWIDLYLQLLINDQSAWKEDDTYADLAIITMSKGFLCLMYTFEYVKELIRAMEGCPLPFFVDGKSERSVNMIGTKYFIMQFFVALIFDFEIC